MKTFLPFVLFIAIAGCVSSPDAEEKVFTDYLARFNKAYNETEEFNQRLKIFKTNWNEIKEHNSKNGKWRKAVNQFTDMTTQEFNDVYGTGRVNIHRPSALLSTLLKSERPTNLPKNKDWRKEKVITSVKDQGACGSCWAHAATEQIESYLALETNSPLTNLSVQQITSCTPNTLQCGGGGGCKGSVESFAFSYAEFFGVVSEEDWPYVSGKTSETEECFNDGLSASKSRIFMEPVAFVRGQETLPHNDYDAILNHIANIGPLAISVAATNGWKHYGGGVFDGCSYSENIELNHAVQLVGYGTDETLGDYWLVRNSWGASWGEDGYIRLLREPEVKCGVDTTPLNGSGCKNDGVTIQKVCGMCGVLQEASYPIGTTNKK